MMVVFPGERARHGAQSVAWEAVRYSHGVGCPHVRLPIPGIFIDRKTKHWINTVVYG